jgi:hypothetical protein
LRPGVMTFSTIAVLAAWTSFMADKFRQHVQRTAQILREKLWRASGPEATAVPAKAGTHNHRRL